MFLVTEVIQRYTIYMTNVILQCMSDYLFAQIIRLDLHKLFSCFRIFFKIHFHVSFALNTAQLRLAPEGGCVENIEIRSTMISSFIIISTVQCYNYITVRV